MRERREELMTVMMKIDSTTRIDLLSDPDRMLVRQGTLRRQTRSPLHTAEIADNKVNLILLSIVIMYAFSTGEK